MRTITAVNEITADAPAQAVWALLADASRWPQWYAACRRVHSSAPGPIPVSATFDWKAHPFTPAQRGLGVRAAASSDRSFPRHLL